MYMFVPFIYKRLRWHDKGPFVTIDVIISKFYREFVDIIVDYSNYRLDIHY